MANEGTVGLLRVVLTASTAEFSTALSQASVKLDVFDRETRNATQNLKRLTESFSGQKIAAEAARVAEAVSRVGGVSKLTAVELSQVRGTIDAATAKFRAMGEVVPPSIAKLSAELDRLGVAAKGASTGGVGSLLGSLGGLSRLIPGLSVAGAIATITGLAKAAFTAADEIVKFSERTGVSIEQTQRWQYVAGQTSTTLDAFAQNAFRLGVNVSKGSREARDAILDLGLSFTTVKNLKPEEQFDTVVKALEGVRSETERNRIGMTLFGKSFAEIAPAISEGYSKLAADASRMSDEQVKALERAGDAWEGFKNRVLNISGSMLANVSLMIEDTIAALTLGDVSRFTEAQQSRIDEALGRGGEGLARVLRDISEARSTDIELTQKQSSAQVDYVQRLAEVQAKLASLKPEERAQIDAALKLGGATDELADQYGLTVEELRLYTSATKTSIGADRDKQKSVEAAIEAQKRFLASIRDLTEAKVIDAGHGMRWIATLDTLAPSLSDAADKTDILEATQEALASSTDIAARAFEPFKARVFESGRGLQDTDKKVQTFSDSLRELSQAFANLAQVTGGLDGAVGSIAALVNATALSSQAGTQLRGAFDLVQEGMSGFDRAGNSVTHTAGEMASALVAMASAAIAGAAALVQVTDRAGRANRALAGAMTGAALGAQIAGGWGAVIGGAVGALVGLFRKPGWESAMREVGRDYGVKISEGLARQIDRDAKALFGNSRQWAAVFNLDKIIAEAGGLTSRNVEQFTAHLRNVFVGLGTGALTAAQAVQVLDRNWAAFVEAGTDKNGRLTDSLREIITLYRSVGLESKAIDEFLRQQASTALEGFAKVVQGAEAAQKGYHDLAAEVVAAREALKELKLAGGAPDAITAASQRLEDALRRQATAAQDARQELEDLGIQALAVFNAAIASGVDYYQALEQIGPALASLQQSYADLGIATDDAALNALFLQNTIARGNPALVSGVDGLTQSFIALSNLGLLNADTFRAMQRTGLQMYTRLQSAAAAAGGTTRDALLPMQTYLQQAAAQARLLGIPLDDNTQMLIDQSQELGIWRDQGKSAFEQVTDAVGELVDTLKDFIDELRHVPANVNTTVTTRYQSTGDVPAPGSTPNTGGVGEADPGFASGTRGRFGRWLHDFGRGTPTRLHGQEIVATRAQLPALARDLVDRGYGDMPVTRGADGGDRVTTDPNNGVILLPILRDTGSDPQTLIDSVMEQLGRRVAGNSYALRTTLRAVLVDG